VQYLQPTRYILDSNGTYAQVESSVENSIILVNYDDTITDIYLPIFTLTRFILYFGWLHVAESLINPFGEDDEDFDINYLINRNVQISYLMVEATEYEDDLEDPFNKDFPISLPHTNKSMKSLQESQAPTLAYATDNLLENMTVGKMAFADEATDGASKRPNQDIEASMNRHVLTKSMSTPADAPSVTRKRILATTISASSMAQVDTALHRQSSLPWH
jgi:hypothetical protein